MSSDDAARVPHKSGDVLQALLEIGVNLSVMPDRRQMLAMILLEARKLCRAEAGSLYVLRKDRLQFVAAQNNRIQLPKVFLEKEIIASANSLAGYVAATGQVVNIPNADTLADNMPYQINRAFDAASGYHTQSILAIPLKRPDGQRVGVLQLLNRLDEGDRVVPFPDAGDIGILSLASMAAVTIHNTLLQEEIRQAHLDTVIRLSVVVEHRDNATADHIRRMSRTATLLARAIGMDPRQVELIECASPMHDIGKIGIPDAILLKPGVLTTDEREVIKTHTLIGGQILAHPQHDLIEVARDVALAHHERWDGRGYPSGLAGEKIPLVGRIACLADVVDALLTPRSYKEAFALDKVLDIVRTESGKQFDPTIGAALFPILDTVLEPYGLVPAAASPRRQ